MKNRKNRKFKKLRRLLVGLAAVLACFVIFVWLLLHKPVRYERSNITDDSGVSTYLTHELSPRLYNGAQQQQPFDLVVTQQGINDIIVRSQWPRESDGIVFSAPRVLFVADAIVLMSTVAAGGAEFVITLVAEPCLDRAGLLNLPIAKVKLGAVNITFLARAIAESMYKRRHAVTNIHPDNLGGKIAASLLNARPFEPVFTIDDKKLRLRKVTIEPEKLTLSLVPLSD